MVCRNDTGIMCELCETWFHCKCQEVSDDAYEVSSHEKIHFYFGRCDKVMGMILKSVSELHSRQDKLENRTKVEEGLTQFIGERLDQQWEMETELGKLERSCKRLSRVW
jgi:hypothetical protein